MRKFLTCPPPSPPFPLPKKIKTSYCRLGHPGIKTKKKERELSRASWYDTVKDSLPLDNDGKFVEIVEDEELAGAVLVRKNIYTLITPEYQSNF